MIKYLERTKLYYGAQGYPAYRWAKNDEVAFTQPTNPISKSRLALLTTAAPFQSELADQGPGASYNAEAKFFSVFTAPVQPVPDLRISHIGYDRKHCKASDANTWLPVPALQKLASSGQLGELAQELIGVPTNRSQRVTLEQDAPAALDACRRLNAEVALLVPT